MGLPGAGKSTVARAFVEQGYARLNRDEAGGSLRGLLPALERLIEAGASRVVLDNTYVSRASRALVVQAATRLGLPVRCVWLSTSIEAAQVNAAWRMVSKFGRLLEPDEMRKTAKRDVSAFPPGVQFRHQRELEPPDPSEGFSRIETMSFERTRDAIDDGQGADRLVRRRAASQPVRRTLTVITGRRRGPRRTWSDASSLRAGRMAAARSVLAARDRGQDADPGAGGRRLRPDAGIAGRFDRGSLLSARRQARPSAGAGNHCPDSASSSSSGIVSIRRSCIYVGAGPQDPASRADSAFSTADANDFFSSATL